MEPSTSSSDPPTNSVDDAGSVLRAAIDAVALKSRTNVSLQPSNRRLTGPQKIEGVYTATDS